MRTAHRFTLAEFDTLTSQGVVDDRAELVLGTIYDPVTESPQHANFVALLGRQLAASLSAEMVRTEQVVLLGESAPRPDVSVLHTQNGFDEHISANHLRCLIEVAVSSQTIDLGEKADLYRRHVSQYAVILLNTGEVVVPTGFDQLDSDIRTVLEDALSKIADRPTR